MDIVPLTLVISLCLTFTFIVFFAREQARRRFGSSETESLLPLLDETRNAPVLPAASVARRSPDHLPAQHPRGHYPEAHA